MMISNDAERIFNLKYAHTLANGQKETWPQCATRVAEYVSRAETRESDRLQMLADFTRLIYELSFIPGGRILANAGSSIKNLMNCFVLPIYDTRESIYDALAKAAEVFAWGGGIGYNFSNIREKGATVRTTGGIASGPVSFMELFDTTGEVISQASRRGAQMGILNCDHPDIFDFINHKATLNSRNKRIYDEYVNRYQLDESLYKVLTDNQLTHFNISVGITDEFMKACLANKDWELIPRLYSDKKTSISALSLLHEIAINSWRSGDPGVYFIDAANADNLVPYLGTLDATNPCGEVPLLPYEACCLGSINLSNFVEDRYIDFDYLKHTVKTAVRFLDNVQDLNNTPVQEINESLKRTRRLGLGVMGFSDVLAEMGIPYDHEEALDLAKSLGRAIQTWAWEASMELADIRGAFPAFSFDEINWKIIDNLGLRRTKLRNVAVTSIAPTGTIALIAGVNSSIEPYFSRRYKRNITEGIGNNAKDSIIQESKFKNVKTAHEVHWRNHIDMQAVWQNYTDNAVSKTINMGKNVTKEEIQDAIIYAWEKNCKGLTIYRDKSRAFQILESEQ